MWPYWLMFLLPATAAIHFSVTPGSRRQRWNVLSVCAVVFITLAVGYRYQVGGDWKSYLEHFDNVRYLSLAEALALSDPGYALLNWVSASLGMDIYGVNLMCGAIFAIGLLHFCLSLPRPWLALTAAVPYMLIVVGMGYSRQAVALAFSMLGLVALRNRSVLWFLVWGILGASFHKTAVMLLPIAGLAASRNRLWSFFLAGVASYAGYLVLLQDSFDSMYSNYVGGEVQSEGAMIRLSMNAFASVFLLVWAKFFQFTDEERSLWEWMAWISLAMLGALLAVSSASTAVDRMALYLLPIQLVVASHLPSVLQAKMRTNTKLATAYVIGYTALVQFIWLNFANYSAYWLPYRFYPIEYP